MRTTEQPTMPSQRIPRIVAYLNACASDLRVVFIGLHREKVLELYNAESWLNTWRIHLHQRTGTPYAVRYNFKARSIDYEFPSATPSAIRSAIINEQPQNRIEC